MQGWRERGEREVGICIIEGAKIIFATVATRIPAKKTTKHKPLFKLLTKTFYEFYAAISSAFSGAGAACAGALSFFLEIPLTISSTRSRRQADSIAVLIV